MRAVFKYLISFQGLEALDLFLLVPKISPYSENKEALKCQLLLLLLIRDEFPNSASIQAELGQAHVWAIVKGILASGEGGLDNGQGPPPLPS